MYELQTQDGDVFHFPNKEVAVGCVMITWPNAVLKEKKLSVGDEVVTDVYLKDEVYAILREVDAITVLQNLFS